MAHVRDILTAPGSRPYELLLEIGSGGMAKVFLGRAEGAGGFQRYVAIKVCHEHLARDQAFRGMFLDEARLAARIHHPNVVPTLDVGESEHLYLVMEYVEGERLAGIATAAEARGAPVPVPVVLRILIDALAGLHAAHETTDSEGQNLGIVHRDASAHNIMVGMDGITRILDFGIAKAVSQSSTTKEGHIKGKIGYMPPEYLHTHQVGRFTDVYAVGVVAWELLAGRRLFEAETEGQTVAAVMRGNVPTLPSLRADVPAAVDAVIRQAVFRDPAGRYATAAEFAEALESTGVAPASHRAVGAYVEALIGESISERRRLSRDAERASTLADGVTKTAADEDGVPAEGSAAPRKAWLVAAALVVTAAVALAWWWTKDAAQVPAASAPPAQTVTPTPTAAQGSPPDVHIPPPIPKPAVDAGAPDGQASAIPAKERNRVRSGPRNGSKRRKARSEWLPDDI